MPQTTRSGCDAAKSPAALARGYLTVLREAGAQEKPSRTVWPGYAGSLPPMLTDMAIIPPPSVQLFVRP